VKFRDRCERIGQRFERQIHLGSVRQHRAGCRRLGMAPQCCVITQKIDVSGPTPRMINVMQSSFELMRSSLKAEVGDAIALWALRP
jgi:hypothetical protein